ncbi:MAG: hypothetical protein ABI844_09255 [Saprospiraceae bacterium]
MKKILLLTLLFSVTLIHAQREETIFQNMRFSGVWGSWNSMIGKVKNENVYFRGGYGGFEFGKDIFVGWGGYKSSSRISADDFKYNMKWNGPVVSYAPSSYRALHPVFTLMVANGKLDPDNQPYDRILVVQPSLGAELNLLRWCHASVHGGYRFVNDVDLAKYTDADFSSFYGELVLKFGISWGRW